MAPEIEERFSHRAVLYIGSESYDAATITVLQGLQALGFKIYTLNKPNINSWFVNTVVDELPAKIDFTLSNLHWGTRWDYYEQHDLPRPWVLIDGDDAYYKGWRAKLDSYVARYKTNVLGEVKDKELSPYRWMEPLPTIYEPNAVFCSQNPQVDEYYLPFGIHNEYMCVPEVQRDIDFTCFYGHGCQRAHALQVVARLPGRTWVGEIRGQVMYPSGIRHIARQDRNVHSWHRWAQHRGYWGILARTKTLIYPAPDHGWESKRPYEAWAAGCLVVTRHLPSYLMEYLGPGAESVLTYGQPEEIPTICDVQCGFPEHFRKAQQAMAMARLMPIPIARYFLEKVWRCK